MKYTITLTSAASHGRTRLTYEYSTLAEAKLRAVRLAEAVLEAISDDGIERTITLTREVTA